MLKYPEIKKRLFNEKLMIDALIVAVVGAPFLGSALLRLSKENVLRREASAYYQNYRLERGRTEDDMEMGIILEKRLNGSLPSKAMQKRLDLINDAVFMHEKLSMHEEEKYFNTLKELKQP